LREILEIADRITVLRDGEIMSVIEKQDFDMKRLIDEIIGKKAEDQLIYKKNTSLENSDLCLSVKNLTWVGNRNSVSFNLYKGEVLGLIGLMGSGRTEVMEVLFGLRKQEDAEIELNGKELHLKNANDAIRKGIVLIPEDRRREGLILMHTVKENLCLTNFRRVFNGLFISKAASKRFSKECIEDFNIKTDNADTYMLNLSGGNQQKVVISKWFKIEPEVLLMDEPTAGVDIGAKVEIVSMVRDFCSKHKSVIFNSSELSEVMAICDRIIVLEDGKVKTEILRHNIHKEEELQYELQN